MISTKAIGVKKSMIRRFDLAKILFVLSIIALCSAAAFGIGLYSGAKKNFIFYLVADIRNDLREILETASVLVFEEPVYFLQPARQPGAGVTINERPNDDALILLSGFFDGGNQLRLIRRDGTVVAHWPVNYSELFPDTSHLLRPPRTDWNVDIHGALVHPDGSVVFNFEYAGTVKLSRCNEPIWTLPHPTHHSVELAEGGGYWIPGRSESREMDSGAFPPFSLMKSRNGEYKEDLILRVSPDGKIVESVSVPRLLYENGLEPLLTVGALSFDHENVGWNGQMIHLNKVGELKRDVAAQFSDFDAGDLVLSLRQYNMVLVVDPRSWRVKWYRIGPWRRQHDPEFLPDGTISVFNNNAYGFGLGAGERSDPTAPRVTNIVNVDPDTGHAEVVFGEREEQRLLTFLRGALDPTPEGGYLITEFEAGRVIETDATGRIVWEYINRYDADNVAEITGARSYPADFFTVDDWTCSRAESS